MGLVRLDVLCTIITTVLIVFCFEILCELDKSTAAI